MKATLVRDLLGDLLTAAAAVVTAPPERQYVAHGNFAHDCELLAVRLVNVVAESDDQGAGAPACAVIPVLRLEVTLLRCYPKVDENLPTAAELTAASATLADDAVALTGGLLARWSAGTLFPTAGIHCDRVEIGELTPVGPSGGIAGWRTTFDVRT